MKKYTIHIEQTTTGYTAYFDEIPVYTSGENMNELLKNIEEAFNYYLSERSIETIDPPY